MTKKRIETFSEVELRKNLDDSYEDIMTCEAALKLGITTYSIDRSVQERLDANKKIVKIIEKELARRRNDQPAL